MGQRNRVSRTQGHRIWDEREAGVGEREAGRQEWEPGASALGPSGVVLSSNLQAVRSEPGDLEQLHLSEPQFYLLQNGVYISQGY